MPILLLELNLWQQLCLVFDKAIALWMQQQKLERVGFVELLDGVAGCVVG
jgi:hypothetical protein